MIITLPNLANMPNWQVCQVCQVCHLELGLGSVKFDRFGRFVT